MIKGKKIISLCLIAGILAGTVGCGNNKDVTSEVTSVDEKKQKEATTEIAAEVSQDTDLLSIENQLQTIAKYAKKWRSMEYGGDPFETESMNYAVTDLDQNGRLEVIASSGLQGSGHFTYTNYFQVNPTGDGIKKIKTSSMADIVGDMSTAYYDPDTKEYHYITGDFATGGVATGYYSDVSALTLRENKLLDETLGYTEKIVKKNGKEKIQYFETYSNKKKEIDASEYSTEEICHKAYANCGKLFVDISWFRFEHGLEDMTEEQTAYYLRKSYEGFSLGECLRLEEKTVSGFTVKIPQYIAMQDEKKQERLNQMIQDAVETDLKNMEKECLSQGTEPFEIRKFECTVKYAGKDRLSILAEMEVGIPSMEHSIHRCHGITIDLDKEAFLTQGDVLPEEYRETVGKLILEKRCIDIKNGKEWWAYKKKKSGQIVEPEEWEHIEVYQTQDSFGIAVQTILYDEVYAIYEVSQADVIEEDSYEDVDWEEYQYRMFPEEYQALQEYMPVLTGGEAFIWEKEKVAKKKITVSEKEKVALAQFLDKKREGEETGGKSVSLDYVSLCDLTGDGGPELLLTLDRYRIYLLLHREGDAYYGLELNRKKLWFQGLQTDGICVRSTMGGEFYYQVTFENGMFQEEMLGGYEFDNGKICYLDGEKTSKGIFNTWYASIESEDVPRYIPVIKGGFNDAIYTTSH